MQGGTIERGSASDGWSNALRGVGAGVISGDETGGSAGHVLERADQRGAKAVMKAPGGGRKGASIVGDVKKYRVVGKRAGRVFRVREMQVNLRAGEGLGEEAEEEEEEEEEGAVDSGGEQHGELQVSGSE